MKAAALTLQEAQNCMDLLLLADPDTEMIARYLKQCSIWGVQNQGNMIAIACFMDKGSGCVELKNLAVSPSFQGRGLASQLLKDAVCRFRQSGYQTILVGTSEEMLSFYGRFGFQYSHTVKNFFLQYAQPVYENGRLLTDMIYLKLEL